MKVRRIAGFFTMLFVLMLTIGASRESAQAEPFGVGPINTSRPLPPGVTVTPSPSVMVHYPAPRVDQFQIVRVVPSWGGPRRTMAPLATNDTCLPQPNVPAPPHARSTSARWGLTYVVSVPSGGLSQVKICQVTRGAPNCFHNVIVSGLSKQETFVPVPQMDAPSITATGLPEFQYELTVYSLGNMKASAYTSKRRLAPLPTISVASHVDTNGGVNPACHAQPCADTQATVTYTNTADIGLFTVFPTTPGGIRAPQGESAIEAGMLPVNIIHAAPLATQTNALVCDARSLSSDDINFWRGSNPANANSYPVRVWARAPAISGCQLTSFTDVVHATISGGASVGASFFCSQGLQVVTPSNGSGGVRVTSAGTGTGTGSGTCHEGDACMVTPAGCQSGFSVAGTMHCSGGTATCAPGPYCPANASASGYECGGQAPADVCSADPSNGSGWCNPNAICGQPCSRNDKGVNECHCRVNPACHNELLCWLPRNPDGSWPGRPAEDACGDGNGGSSCASQCDGSSCGFDGCGGSCGTCADGQVCNYGAPYGGTCVRP